MILVGILNYSPPWHIVNSFQPGFVLQFEDHVWIITGGYVCQSYILVRCMLYANCSHPYMDKCDEAKT